MNEANATVTYLKDYKEPDFFSSKINLTIELNDQDAVVTNLMQVFRNKKNEQNAPLVLNGQNQELLEVKINNQILDKSNYIVDEENLTINNLSDNFEISITSRIKPQSNTSLEGLYLADANIFLTQCEPHGFRNIAYSLDRPDVMSVYTTKLIADKKYQTLLSNGDLIEKGDLENGKHYAVWYDKSKKPSYLFAAVIGDLAKKTDEFITMSGKKVKLEIYTNNSDISKTDYAMYSLKSAMKWDEERFGREYDLDTYMIVSTPKFNAGAMENKGLNIFNSKYILANQNIATDNNFMNVFGVIGHEYFHNWTGNRITLRDWFQLSLKEGLTVFRDQEFTADFFSRPIQRIDDAQVIKINQFKEDKGPLAHPVRPDSYVSMNNFYTVTVYDKGAEVIRMYKTILGEQKFAKAMDLYFQRHDGQAVTTDDFVKVMEDGSGIDLSQFRLWYSQSGTPVVNITSNHDSTNKTLTLKMKQSCPPTPNQPNKQDFMIPIKVGLIGQNSGQNLTFNYLGQDTNETVVMLTKKEQDFVFNNVQEETIPSLLRDFSAPVSLQYPYTDQQLLMLLAHDNNSYNRYEAGQLYMAKYILKLAEQVKSNQSPAIDEELIKAIDKVFNDQSLDNTFIARTITLPSDEIIYNLMEVIDPDSIFNAKEYLESIIGQRLEKQFIDRYNSLKANQYSLSPKAMADRSLKNVCLQYLASGNEKLGDDLAQQQLANADNLTDRFAALLVLFDSSNDQLYQQVSNNTLQNWQNEDLLIDKWLALHGLSSRADTVNKVAELTTHPQFDLKTPNKIYSLIGAFTSNSPKFHAQDGSGYQLLSKIIIQLDKINPNVAARMATKFDSWKRFDQNRQNLIKEELNKIKSQADLSKGTKEIVEKILL